MNYKALVGLSQLMGEKNDCAVVALSIATGTEYAISRAVFRALGRKKGGRTKWSWIEQAFNRLGFKLVPLRVTSKTVRTLSKELKDVKGSFLIDVKGHVLCIKDGVVEDWTQNRCNRIRSVYRVAQEAPTRSVQLSMLRKMYKFCEVTDENGHTLAYPLDPETGMFKNWAFDITNNNNTHA